MPKRDQSLAYCRLSYGKRREPRELTSRYRTWFASHRIVSNVWRLRNVFTCQYEQRLSSGENWWGDFKLGKFETWDACRGWIANQDEFERRMNEILTGILRVKGNEMIVQSVGKIETTGYGPEPFVRALININIGVVGIRKGKSWALLYQESSHRLQKWKRCKNKSKRTGIGRKIKKEQFDGADNHRVLCSWKTDKDQFRGWKENGDIEQSSWTCLYNIMP